MPMELCETESLKEYLKKYTLTNSDEKRNKNIKAGGMVVMVDEDPIWGKPVEEVEDEEDEDAEKAVVVDEDNFDVKRMRRLGACGAISEDGSISEPRKRRPRNDAPLPPECAQQPDTDSSSPRHTKPSSVSDLSPPRKNHPKAGLYSGQDIKREIAEANKESWLSFQKMDPSVSGQDAEATYRSKTGKRISKEEYLKYQKKEEKPKEIKLEWRKGLVQKRAAEARLQELEEEKDKPFAGTRDGPDVDALLKERVRWGDPMAHLVKKRLRDSLFPDVVDSERMKESGFIIPQEVPTHSWIRRGIDAAPNRHGIKPGRHWDGVDRSTGYEKELFKRTNEKRAIEADVHSWSVSDM